MLTADLVNLQYNQIWEATISWMNLLGKYGVMETKEFGNLTSWPKEGYDQEIEQTAYRNWHHEGRRFRHGAEMMGADYTQWHGIWELQENLVKIIEYGAGKGVPEAVEWMRRRDPEKFLLYPLFDVPGNTWGPSAMAYRGEMPMDRIPGYWEKIRENVRTAYEKGVLTEEQWRLWEELYENRDEEIGRVYDLPPIHEEYMENLRMDLGRLYEKQRLPISRGGY